MKVLDHLGQLFVARRGDLRWIFSTAIDRSRLGIDMCDNSMLENG
jgi:hypothetical protein